MLPYTAATDRNKQSKSFGLIPGAPGQFRLSTKIDFNGNDEFILYSPFSVYTNTITKKGKIRGNMALSIGNYHRLVFDMRYVSQYQYMQNI